MIFVTGDTHGSKDISKLSETNFPIQHKMTKNDYVIIAGDFGLIWDNSKRRDNYLQWLTERNFTTLWIDGNHENFELLYEYPVTTWNGGKVHIINESIIHLMRGQVFDIEGTTIFTFGGAVSIDRDYRIPGMSWWEQELPTKEEMREGLSNLRKINNKVDYVITHDCSERVMYELYGSNQIYRYSKDINKYFDLIENIATYKHWYFGHHHKDIMNLNKSNSAVYNGIIRLL